MKKWKTRVLCWLYRRNQRNHRKRQKPLKKKYYSKTCKRESSNDYVNEKRKGILNTIHKFKKCNKEYGPRNSQALEEY